jgi:hypothetical protein
MNTNTYGAIKILKAPRELLVFDAVLTGFLKDVRGDDRRALLNFSFKHPVQAQMIKVNYYYR